jgi:hypothetical protein
VANGPRFSAWFSDGSIEQSLPQLLRVWIDEDEMRNGVTVFCHIAEQLFHDIHYRPHI